METIPKELEETQLSLQLVIDPTTKCITMKTHNQDIPTNSNLVEVQATEVISNDPLHQPSEAEDKDLKKTNELERLIYSERQKLLNLKTPKILGTPKKRKAKDSSYFDNILETDTYQELTRNEKSKLRMRRCRERETADERDFRRFRHRIMTIKTRLVQKLRNFEDGALLKDLVRRNTDRIKQKRLEQKANETREQQALRKREVNTKRRLAIIRRKVFRTPEDVLIARENRIKYLKKFWSRHTEEERKALQKDANEKAKERRRTNQREWQNVEMILKGSATEKSDL